ncbi:MAG: hypothetical protein AAF203_07505 [Pseudomonadota bacterium]
MKSLLSSFALLLIFTIKANAIEIDSSHIVGIAPNMNIRLCKTRATMLQITESKDEIEAGMLARINAASEADRPALVAALETLQSTFEVSEEQLKLYKNMEMGSANINFPPGTVLEKEILTEQGRLDIWIGNPTSQVRFLGTDICAFIDLDEESPSLTPEAIVNFLNSISI